MSERPSIADAIHPYAAPFSAKDLPMVANVVVLIAFSDLDIDAEERAAIRDALNEVSSEPVTDETVDEQIERTRKKLGAVGGLAFAKQVGRLLAGDGKAAEGLALAYAVAASNGVVSEDERWRLDAIAEGAAISSEKYAAIVARFPAA